MLGILLAYLSNYILASTLPSDIAWRWMFMVMAVPAVVFFLLLFTTPETPRWLYMVGRLAEAVETIHRLTNSRDEAAFEIRAIEQTLARSEEHTSELQSRQYLVCRLLLEHTNDCYFSTSQC